MDLDSRSFVFDQIFQDVDTEAGTEYLIAFDFSIHPTEDPNATANTHAFQVFWDNELVGTYTGSETWQTGVISVQGNADTTRLSFAEIQEGDTNGGDGRGALLDNVRVVQATEQVVPNGSFENNSDESSLFYRAYEVEAWGSAGSDDVNERLIKIVEENDTVQATDGTQYLNLDATELTRDIVFTDLQTTEGTTYYVTFDLRTDGDPETDADELRVRWEVPSTVEGDDSGWATTIRGNSEWQQYGIALTATADEMRLMFLEPGSHNGDGSGPLIDNVRIFEIESGSVDQPVVDQPVVDEPVVDQPVVDQPVVDQPVVDGPVAADPIEIVANVAADGVAANAVFVPGAGAQNALTDIALTHSGNISGAAVVLNGIQDGTDEIISVNNAAIPVDASGNAQITVTSYDPDSGQLLLSGEATAAEYQQVLQSLVYFNASDNVSVGDRSISISVTDSSLPDEIATSSTIADLDIETDQAVIDDTILLKFAADNNLTVEQVGALYFVIEDPGSGVSPTVDDFVDVDYSGHTLQLNAQNELELSEAFEAIDGAQFLLSRVIEGWQIGIPLLQTGGVVTLLIPSSLAYGTTGTPTGDFINEVLIFDVELNQVLS